MKTLRPLLLGVVLLLAAGMGGCNSSSTAGAQQAMAEAALAGCNAYVAGLEYVNTVQASLQARTPPESLAPAQVAAFQEVRRDVNPLCTAGTPQAGSVAAIMNGVTRLMAVQTAATTAARPRTGAR